MNTQPRFAGGAAQTSLSQAAGIGRPRGARGCGGGAGAQRDGGPPASPSLPSGPGQPLPPGLPTPLFWPEGRGPSELFLGEREETRKRGGVGKRWMNGALFAWPPGARPHAGLGAGPGRAPRGPPSASPPRRKCFVPEISMQMLFYYYYPPPLAPGLGTSELAFKGALWGSKRGRPPPAPPPAQAPSSAFPLTEPGLESRGSPCPLNPNALLGARRQRGGAHRNEPAGAWLPGCAPGLLFFGTRDPKGK